MKHRCCFIEGNFYTSASGGSQPRCVMCGRPVAPNDAHITWYAPSYPEANEYGRVYRHAQAGDILTYRSDRKWSRERRSVVLNTFESKKET